MKFFHLISTALLSVFLATTAMAASGQDVFARLGDLELTHAEIDAAFARIPSKYRMNFIRDGEKVDQLIQSLFRYKALAAEAASHAFDQNEIVTNRLSLVAEQELAEAWIEQVLEDAPGADFDALAHEQYLASPENFQSQDVVDVSHILIQTSSRPDEKALQQAEELLARLQEDPAQFDALVMEFSEDPSKERNQGRYPSMQRGQMVKPFEDAAFALEEPGQLSAPVKTDYGFHIIRLNAKSPAGLIPFEQVKPQLVEEARQKYLSDYRTRYIISKSEGLIDIQDGAVEAMAKRHFGENLELAPDYYQQ